MHDSRGLVRHMNADESGFALVKTLVVAAITVALAAVILPQFAQLGGGGGASANSEGSNVQRAMDTMLAVQRITSVTANTGYSTNSWTANPTGPDSAPLDRYLRRPTTAYFYCWDAAGRITRQDAAATAC